ncbi:helix-turn-helix domain-containing protein [Streptomyces roseoverticillatus]|uniref:helix-turn-helix domain-containing protein n=1 Tax=Streptomyces roseoverticillatus TaxID=66429 RepID=UPI001F17C03F|nr:helix-turn-helix domain-containing protein [Streptomyces roseoverticillatus]MCF3102388.1 helix-turn-helix domain-containing protein [Streptomyces roseoverticillatus]
MASEFSTLLRRLRHKAGMTQETLAERAGVGVRTIRGLETGERADPRVTTVRLLADALGLAPAESEELLAAAVRRPGATARPGDGPDERPGPADPATGQPVSAERGAGAQAFVESATGQSGPAEPATRQPASAGPVTGRSDSVQPAPGSPPSARSAPGYPPSAPPVPGHPLSAQPAPDHPPSALHGTLADVAEQLAHAVASRWQREEEQRQVHDPYPLPVRWRPVPEELTDHWANIRRLPAGGMRGTHGPLDLSGRLDGIVGVYRRIPSGRLVVLGRPGSGKSILTTRFVLDHITARTRTDPVPVIFSIGTWDPTAITFRDWLSAQLIRDHPGLAGAAPGGRSLAAALVEAGRVLPVLDGFDEIAGGLHRPAMEALNATTLPLLLTSRPAEYTTAVAETDVLTSAAAVELTDLTLDDLADYLPRTTRKARGGDAATTAWDPVLGALREQPRSRGGDHLAEVLTTPLMVTLARAVYSDTPGGDPATLLDTHRFGGPGELEDHLLENFTATAYRLRPEHRPDGASRHGFDPERARHWLGYLAHHLTRLDTPDLEWWRLGSGLRRPTRTLVTALVTCLVVGVVDCVAGTLFAPLRLQIAEGLTTGFLSGVISALSYWFLIAGRNTAVAPSAVRMKVFGRAGTPRRRTGVRVVLGLLCGLVFGLGYGFEHGVLKGLLWGAGPLTTLSLSLYDAVFFGFVFALGGGPTLGLLTLLETPLDIRSAVNPVGLLRTNRRTATAQFLVWVPAFGLLAGIGSALAAPPLSLLLGPLVWDFEASLKLGLISGLGCALGYALTLTAWGQWVVLSRIWLPLTGRLPWSVVAFLEDAYRRGVLRQAGAVYQFRHARLQDHLARTYRSRGATRRSTGPSGAAPG